jgi:hypothetical protein
MSKGWTMAEAAELFQEALPGITSLCLHLECDDGHTYGPVAPWGGEEAVEVARVFCARWKLKPVRVAPQVSYTPGYLPYLVRMDLAIEL